MEQPESLLVPRRYEGPGSVSCDHHLDFFPEGGTRIPDPYIRGAIDGEATTIGTSDDNIDSRGDLEF